MLDLFGHRPTVGATTWTANETIAHELMGHTFAHLGDEYTHPYPGFPDIEEVNTTKTASRDSVKWKDWIQFSLTNIPNELISRNQGEARAVLDPVPGAHYSETGWYRPSVKCKLKELDHEFCRVCTHAIVRSIYNKVKPIDSVTPETAKGKSVDTSLTEPWSISVSLMHPRHLKSAEILEVNWFVNGQKADWNHTVAFSTEDLSRALNEIPQLKGAKTVTLKFTVQDRNPDANPTSKPDPLLSDSREWILKIK